VKERWPEVEKAMLQELQTWAKLKCFSRRPRHSARNIIDVRWVLKNKWEVPTIDASRGGRDSPEAEAVRIVRARLTVRGFKDQERKDVDRYAGTSARSSQKLLVSEAVLRGWDLCTADISKAFLQGVTDEELAKDGMIQFPTVIGGVVPVVDSSAGGSRRGGGCSAGDAGGGGGANV
jgi:hypothetical protein